MPKATDIPAGVRTVVYARDAHRCRWCGRTNGGLHLHHIVYRSQDRNNHEPSNLIALCPRHHDLMHTDKARYTPILQELLDSPAVTGLQLIRWKEAP